MTEKTLQRVPRGTDPPLAQDRGERANKGRNPPPEVEPPVCFLPPQATVHSSLALRLSLVKPLSSDLILRICTRIRPPDWLHLGFLFPVPECLL